MNYGLWLSAAGMQVNEYRQDLIANNLANSETVGFKHDLAVIRERRVESQVDPTGSRFAHPVLDGMTGGAWVRPTYHSFEQGVLVKTDKPLDVAIEGNGFFTVRDGDQVRYTRDGRFVVNAGGELVSAADGGRLRILDKEGSPIRVDRSQPVTISATGVVFQGREPVAKLGVVDVDDAQKLRKVGRNVFAGVGETAKPSTSQLHPGFVEQSTADPVGMLAQMIEAARAYEANARLVTLQDELNGRAATQIGRIR
jgi:flagellar basal-body rod protein FlgF